MLLRPQKSRIWVGKEPIQNYESYSSIQKFRHCPAAFYGQYVTHLREPVGPHLLIGRAFHDTVADVLRQKETNPESPMNLDAALARFEMYWLMENNVARRSRSGLKWDVKEGPEEFLSRGLALIEIWMAEVEPTMRPRGIEQENSFNLKLKGCERTLYGLLDYVGYDEKKRGGFLDWKTSTRTWNAMKGEVLLQIDVYYAGYFEVYKEWPEWSRIIIARTSGKPRIDLVPEKETHRTHAQVQKTFDTIIKPTVKAIEDAWTNEDFPCKCGAHESITHVDLKEKPDPQWEKVLNPELKLVEPPKKAPEPVQRYDDIPF